jgi:hypothetical protein
MFSRKGQRLIGSAALVLLFWLSSATAQSPGPNHMNLLDVGASGSSTEDASGRIVDTLNVFNHSGVGFYDPEVKAILPAGLRFVVVDRRTDACSAVGQIVTCQAGTLRVMQSVDIKIVLQAADPAATPTRSYTVYPLDGDAHPDNNTVTLTSAAPAAPKPAGRTPAP